MQTGAVETYKITILVVLRDFFLGELFGHCGWVQQEKGR